MKPCFWKIRLADARTLKAFNQSAQEVFARDGEIQGLSQYGTAEIVPLQDLWGGLPTQNWHSGHMGPERANAISGEKMYDEILPLNLTSIEFMSTAIIFIY